jgi:hypothetical protein
LAINKVARAIAVVISVAAIAQKRALVCVSQKISSRLLLFLATRKEETPILPGRVEEERDDSYPQTNKSLL